MEQADSEAWTVCLCSFQIYSLGASSGKFRKIPFYLIISNIQYGGTSIAWNLLHWNYASWKLSLGSKIMPSTFMAYIFITNYELAKKHCSGNDFLEFIEASQHTILMVKDLYNVRIIFFCLI